MATLGEMLLEQGRRPQTVDTLVGVVDEEVKTKSGIGGAAIKTGYGAAKKIDASLVRRAINGMLPDFLGRLDTYWASRGDQPFGAYLAANGDAVAEALLAVTDERAARPKHAAAAKVYGKLRGRAKDNVVAALPRLGTAIEGLAG